MARVREVRAPAGKWAVAGTVVLGSFVVADLGREYRQCGDATNDWHLWRPRWKHVITWVAVADRIAP